MNSKKVLSTLLTTILILTTACAVASADEGGCVVPTDDLYINKDTVLCPGFYDIEDSGATGVIIINADDVVLDCNGATINGTGVGRGIYNPGFDNVAIKNGGVMNYQFGISLSSYTNDNQLINNTANYCSGSGFYLQASSGVRMEENVADSNKIGINLYDSSKNELLKNTARLNNYGFYTGGSSYGNILNQNTACDNRNYDLYMTKNSGSGDDNICDLALNWNDTGTAGCTYDCAIGKPDLVITDISNEDGTICYEIKNIGDATASEGHYTTLFVDGEYQIKEQVDVDLTPGASVKRCFDLYTWDCTAPEDKLKVCADYGNFVDESNEKNNCQEETWTCTSPGDAIIYHTDLGAGIWRMNPDGSENTQLSDHGWFAEYSPGNAKIAFGEYYQSGIWVMDPDGTDQVQLTSSGNAPTWSPDGTKIAYHIGGATVTDRRIWIVNADGSNAQKLSDSPGDFPAWSPDGTKIAYNGEVDNDIRLINPDGTGDTQLCAHSRDPAWSLNGEKIAYRSLTDGCIWTMNADGSGKTKISTNAGKHPAWSLDGTKIAYEDVANKMGIGVINADGTDEHLINQGGHAPDWMSPGIPEELPDLVITDVWNEDGNICYQIRNIGEETAQKGHYASLSIDDKESANDLIDSELKPGERLKRCFNYGWQCTSPDDAITVCADHGDDVNEASEGNNCRKETWKCDVIPPKIISGPVVSGITQSSVTISWTTNEDSDSLVRFGRTAGKYEDQKSGLKLIEEHTIILTDLLPSTTYHYLAQSTDASENTVVSRDGLFETGPVPDDEPPVVHALNITRGKGAFLYYELSADVSDNTGVERVEFYIDDRLIGTDYSEPYLCYLAPAYMEMSREEFFEEHTVEAAVFDLGGMVFESSVPWGPPYEVMSVTAKILTPCCSYPHPYPGYLYTDDGAVPDGTTVDIIVRATEYELGEERPGTPSFPGDIPPPIREIIPHPVRRVEFYLDGTLIGTSTTPSSTYEKYIYTHTWDASGLFAGDYEIEARAIATDGTVDNATCTVTVAEGTPYVMPARSVSRIGNYFEVTLTLSNPGTASARVDTITDHVVGFQAVGKSAEEYSVTTDYTTGTKDCEILIDLFTDTTDTITLSPGESFRVVYSVVPILYDDATDYSIGEETVISYYDPSGRLEENRITSPSSRTFEGEWFPSSVDNAIGTSDYLIATNPARLFTHYTDADVEELLSSMAGLAVEKNGVLGYLDTYSRSTFKNLIEPGGDWSSRLTTDWTSEGYLLIVGETEIVPSRDISDTGIRDATSGWSGGSVYPVTCVDNTYADLSGSDNLPELIVARIIGDSADQLTTPIETSLLDQFERTDAFVISGTGNGQSSFETNADEVAGIIDDEFTVDLMHGGDYANDAARLAQFTTRARDKDVLFYRDHGSIGCWSHTICTGSFPVNFGNSYPFAFGSVCLSGHFEGSYCIGEAFLDSGAGVYIGATESSGRDANNEAGLIFFDRWVGSSDSIGEVFKETKRELMGSSPFASLTGYERHVKRLWLLEYNLYGDPKYGTSPDFSSAFIAEKASWQLLSSLEVTVPDYEVTERDELHYVKIPGGQSLLEPDNPRVPIYVTSVDYARGYEVKDVVLTERSGLTTTTGLNLPIVSMDPGGDGSESPETLSESADSEWYPDEEYRWQIIENPDGSTTLLIIMYPFYYNPLTTDARFYKNYKFEINYTTSAVEITTLTTDKDVYPEGDDVLVNLWLNNSGDAQDVFVDAVVKAGGSGEVASGLLLQTLKGFEGLASFSPQWDSSGVDPGYYFVEVTLKDTSGDVLDRKTGMFRLGISSGEIASFTATPEYFDIGDTIEMEMTFKNNGTVNITGTAIIRVLNSTGDVTEEFRHNVTSLTPSGSISFSDMWDTSGAEVGSSYTIIGYVLYDSKSTDPVAVTVQNMIMGDLNRDGVVTPADAAIALELAASGEWDPAADVNCDGEITSLDALMILQAAAGNMELEGCESS